jgi:glycogen synthase
MDWIAGNSLYKSSPYTRQQCMQLIFTIHNIEFLRSLQHLTRGRETGIQHEQFCTMFTLMDFKIRQVPSLCRRNQRHNVT